MNPWATGRVDMAEDLVTRQQHRVSRDPYAAGEIGKELARARSLSPLTVTARLLFDPDTPAVEMDRQLSVLVNEARRVSKQARFGTLRPYDNPLDGVVIGEYFKERSVYHFDVHREMAFQLMASLSYAWTAIINRARIAHQSPDARKRAIDQLFVRKDRLVASLLEDTNLVRAAIAQATSLGTIVTRNSLYADEHTMIMKRNPPLLG